MALSNVCITYLRFQDFRRDSGKDCKSATPESNRKNFLDYSTNHWIYHMQQLTLIDEELVRKAGELCDVGNGPFSFWLNCHHSKWLWEIYVSRKTILGFYVGHDR